MITHKFGENTYIYYTQEEADELGMDYVRNWREAETGDWTLTDDGYVAKVSLSRVTADRFKRRWVRIPTGTYLDSPGTRMLALEKRASRSSFSGKKTNHKDPNRRLLRKEHNFVAAYLSCFDHKKAYQIAVGADPDAPTFAEKSYEYLRRANVQKEINKGIRERFNEMGLDGTWIGDQLKKLGEEASKEDVRLRAVKLVGEILGVVQQKQLDGPGTIMIAHKEIQLLEAESERLKGAGREIGAVSGKEAVITAEDEDGHGFVRENDVPEGLVQGNSAVP